MDGGLWHSTGDMNQDHPHRKEMQKSKMPVWEALQIAEKEKWKAGDKEKYTHLDAEFQRITEWEKKG